MHPDDDRPHDPESENRRARRGPPETPLVDLAARFVRSGVEAVTQTTERLREKGEQFDPKDIVTGAAQLGLRGKEELVSIVAREVRSYMEKLQIGDDVRAFLTGHTLEVQASLRLRPLGDAVKEAARTDPPADR